MSTTIKLNKYILTDVESELNPNSKELAEVIIQRLGLMPRKKGSTESMYRVLMEFYERAKDASQKREPARAVITVEDMASLAGITRQTMYEYLDRWIDLDLIVKTSYIDFTNKAVIGYRLNGNTLEQAFEKVRIRLNQHLDLTSKYIKEIQRIVKNEKISETSNTKNDRFGESKSKSPKSSLSLKKVYEDEDEDTTSDRGMNKNMDGSNIIDMNPDDNMIVHKMDEESIEEDEEVSDLEIEENTVKR